MWSTCGDWGWREQMEQSWQMCLITLENVNLLLGENWKGEKFSNKIEATSFSDRYSYISMESTVYYIHNSGILRSSIAYIAVRICF